MGDHKALHLFVLLIEQCISDLGQFSGLGVLHKNQICSDALLHGAGAVQKHLHQNLSGLVPIEINKIKKGNTVELIQ